MTVTVELPPELELRFLAEAKSRGVSIELVVQAYLLQHSARAPQEQVSAEEMNKIMDEIADSIPPRIPLSDEALSRASIYTREDEW